MTSIKVRHVRISTKNLFFLHDASQHFTRQKRWNATYVCKIWWIYFILFSRIASVLTVAHFSWKWQKAKDLRITASSLCNVNFMCLAYHFIGFAILLKIRLFEILFNFDKFRKRLQGIIFLWVSLVLRNRKNKDFIMELPVTMRCNSAAYFIWSFIGYEHSIEFLKIIFILKAITLKF